MGKGSRRSSAAGGWGSQGAEGRAALCLRVGGWVLGWLDGDARRGEPNRGVFAVGIPGQQDAGERWVAIATGGRRAGDRTGRTGAGEQPGVERAGWGGVAGPAWPRGSPPAGSSTTPPCCCSSATVSGGASAAAAAASAAAAAPLPQSAPRPPPPGVPWGGARPRSSPPGQVRASGYGSGGRAGVSQPGRGGQGAGQGGGWGEGCPAPVEARSPVRRRQVGSAGLSR